MKRIGIIPPRLNCFQNIKTKLLLYDEIHLDMWNFGQEMDHFSTFKNKNMFHEFYYNIFLPKSAEIDFLIDKQIVKDIGIPEQYFINYKSHEKLLNISSDSSINTYLKFESMIHKASFKNYLPYIPDDEKKRSETASFKEMVLGDEYSVRIDATILNTINDNIYIPVLDKFTNLHPSNLTKQVEIFNILLKKIPVPEESVSIEQIIDFKNDEQSIRAFRALKNWVTDIAYSKYSNKEIEEKIEFLLSEYEYRMNLHKMKFKYSNIEMVFSAGLETLENIFKFNWSKIGKSFFNIRKRKADILIGETKAPGKEMAYLSHVKEKMNTVPNNR